MTAWQTVHVRVNDAATGRPTPVRIRFAGSDGTYHAPLGRLAQFATVRGVDVGGNVLTGGKEYAYIDGACEIRLPVNSPLDVEITKGPEYRALRSHVTLPPGKLALRFVMDRWVNWRAEGWFSADVCAHFLGPQAALLEATAEDVAVVNLLAIESQVWGQDGRQYPAVPNILDFSGQAPARERGGHMVVVNTLNGHDNLGRLLLLNCHRPVYPLSFGGPDGFDDWALADWCDQCHRKGGLVVGDSYFESFYAHGYARGELLADLILGKLDALRIEDHEIPEPNGQPVLADWYDLLDCGFRVPLVAGSHKDSNRAVLGQPRTYARLQPGEELTYKAWVEAVRAGRTFVSSGPLLTFTVNDQGPGAVLNLPAGGGPVHVRASSRSQAPFACVEVIVNGTVVARAEAAGSPCSAHVETDVTVSEGGWLAARCHGPCNDPQKECVAALTSPVYLQVDGRGPPVPPATVTTLAGYLDEMLAWVRDKGRFENDPQRQRLAGIFQSAKAKLPAQ
jgi:hypothetical protein